MKSQIKRALSLVGPYPYNPYLIFLLLFALFFSRFAPLTALVPAGYERLQSFVLIILLSAIPGGIHALGAGLLNKYRFWSSKSFILYVLEVASFLFLNFHLTPQINGFLQRHIGHSSGTLISLNFNVFAMLLVLILIALALLHKAEQRISAQLDLASKLVSKLEAEREVLIQSDEELRRHASQFLHDRVQSDLMVVGIELKSISGQVSSEVKEVIERSILRLENTRALDLRNLIQNLTPNLNGGNLKSALDILVRPYRTNINISLQIDEATEDLESQISLGIFRIVEQSILNALVHGPANRVHVNVSTSHEGMTVIIVDDDGPGIASGTAIAGIGTAIIDSWVGIFKGTKEINSVPNHGYRLKVTFSNSI